MTTEAAPVVLKGASDREYGFNFGTNTACRVEDLTNKSYGEVIGELRGPHPSVRLLRLLVKAALVDPADQDDVAVGAIIDDIGGWGVVHAALTRPPSAEPSQGTGGPG